MRAASMVGNGFICGKYIKHITNDPVPLLMKYSMFVYSFEIK
jgi:hypothetical protein